MINKSSWFLLLGLSHLVYAELFTSLKDLERVLFAEKYLVSDLHAYIQKEELRLAELRKIANEWESHSTEALANPEKHLENPVNAFLLVKRFTTDWVKVQNDFIRTNASDEFFDMIQAKSADFPQHEDLNGAATSLLRIQDTYALSAEKIARGDLQGVQNSPELTAEECFELGRQAYVNNDFYHAVLWMDESLKRLEKEQPPTVGKAVVLDYYAFSTASQGNTQHALNLTIEWLKLEPDHQRALNNKFYYEKTLSEKIERTQPDAVGDPEQIQNQRLLNEYRSGEEFRNYEALCRGEKVMPIPNEHMLSCQFKRHHPFFYISPLREETINFKPWIALYHDMLTEKEIAKIKELSTPKLHTSVVFGQNTPAVQDFRISKSGWIDDKEDEIIRKLSIRTGAFCNLSLETVEHFQVLNYGIGGQYEPHCDFSREPEQNFDLWQGNRILTAIYYLTDVVAGGYTVFPHVGIKVAPRKGSCAVWYNLLANGEGDEMTVHAGCPVFTGSKWVANKWFHVRGQEFTRPCALDPQL